MLCHSFGMEVWLGAKGLPKSSRTPRMHPHLSSPCVALTYFPTFSGYGEARAELRGQREGLLCLLDTEGLHLPARLGT